MSELLPYGNVMNDDGDVVSRHDFFLAHDADSDIAMPEHHVAGLKNVDLRIAQHATSQVIDTLPTSDVDTLPLEHEWQHEKNVWYRLGLNKYSGQDYKNNLSSADYDTWQRVVRNYAKALQNRFKRIGNVEGETEYDYALATEYGADRTPSELMEYAIQLDNAYTVLTASGVIDAEFDDLTKKKLEHAPHYSTVAVVETDKQKLALKIVDK